MMNRVSGSDYNQLRREAQTRWLKPAEIYYILQNHENYPIAQEASKKPPSGSLFLFNRRVLRFFRKDGHSWRKKKDGRAVGEAHERLKVGNVDALNCYYAHGEQNPYFQRRSYWMLDPAYEHIVLVHYREVAEGRFISSSISNMSLESSSILNQSSDLNNVQFQGNTYERSELYEQNRCSCSPGSAEEVSSKLVIENHETNCLNIMNGSGTSDLSPQPEVNQALRKLTEQLSLDDDENTIYFGEKLPACTTGIETSQASGPEYLQHCQIGQPGNLDGYNSIQSHKVSGASGEQGSHSLRSDTGFERRQFLSWTDMLEISSDSAGINAHGMNLLAPEGIPKSANSRTVVADFPASNMLKHGNEILAPSSEKEKATPFGQAEQLIWEKLDNVRNNAGNGHIRYHTPESDLSLQLSATRRFLLGSDDPILSPTPILQFQEAAIHHTSGSTREVNSNAVSLQKENSADWMGTIDLGVVNSACRSSLSGMWFNQGQYDISSVVDSSLTVAQKQRFTIREISPEWAFPFERTKVIITGDFLCDPLECRWAIMFGDIEVPVEIVQQGVLRCQTPQHSAGKVTLCITSGNRESCSELREFEFRATPNEHTSTRTDPDHATKSSEEMLLLTKLAYMLLCGVDALSILKNCSETGSEHFVKSRTGDDEWSQIIEALVVGCENPSGTMEWILQELLKDKLKQWLSSKYQCNEGEGCLLTKQEQGIIHLISGLGYEFALNPILDSRVGINFRDANGWTALHWAARFGREEMVAALLAAGASAGAVTDPTRQDPVGKTPGAISAAYGHRGLAGYLSEVDLTSHLSSLTMEESELSKGSAEVEAERAVESISCRSVHVGGTEDELSLKDSLAAVRNAAQAAARIQAAFRAHSFRRRQQMFATNQDEYGLTAEDIRGLSISSKFQRAVHGSRDQKFDIAALAIQKKYRGWKGRKDFLTLRKHVVKIQAHVRGHQERKKYMEFLWTVSVVEKVVLRWRRKGVGLRGFRAEPELIDEGEEEVEDIAKVFRKQKVDAAIDQAVSRVLAMVDSPDARQQYRRMLERYRQAKVQADLSTVDEAAPRLQDDYEIIESDDFMYRFE